MEVVDPTSDGGGGGGGEEMMVVKMMMIDDIELISGIHRTSRMFVNFCGIGQCWGTAVSQWLRC